MCSDQMMKRALVILLLLLASPVLADSADDQFKRGVDARHRGDYATALKEFRRLAEQGSAPAQLNLGLMYDNGEGVTQDYADAVRWYRKAAVQGDAKAQYTLGLMSNEGRGLTKDDQAAISWFCKAAKQGHASAQNNLGILNVKRRAVVVLQLGIDQEELVQAHMWFNLAAARSSGADRDKFVKNRDILAKNMSPTDVSAAQRLAREWTPEKPCSTQEHLRGD